MSRTAPVEFIARHRRALIEEWLGEIRERPQVGAAKASALAQFGSYLLDCVAPQQRPFVWQGPDPDCDLDTLVRVCGCLRRRVWQAYRAHAGASSPLGDLLEAQERLDAAIEETVCRAAARRAVLDAAPPACPYAFSNAIHCPMTQSDNERRRLLAVLEQLPAGVVIVDALTRKVVLWNDEGKHLTGLNEHGQTLDGMLRHIRAVRPNGEPWLEEDPMRLALGGTRVRNLESVLVHGDGNRRTHLVNAGPIRDRDGHIVAALVTVVDISDRKAMEEELRAAALFHERFMGILGHDLRNPLNAIYLNAQLLRRALRPQNENGASVDRIIASSERMSRMIRDLLDFTKGRFGGIPIHPQLIDLRRVCEDVVDEVRAAHPGRHIELRMEGDLRGRWDGDRIAQAISNLLVNALVHGALEGAVVVSVRRGADDVELGVSNLGPPIPEQELEHLFDPFKQSRRRAAEASGAGLRLESGLGLGLYIVRAIAEAHGGRVNVSSSVSAGTTFEMVLPIGS